MNAIQTELHKFVIEEFSDENTQLQYIKKADEGLWISEKHFIEKYFTTVDAHILDIGCGTGRTTIRLFQMGFKITGIDIVPAMIANAKRIAHEKNLDIDYRIGDATNLEFPDNSFDYALFSNQGWTQIPGRENRFTALKETYRVLKPEGIFIFTAYQRVIDREYAFFWFKQWMRFHVLRRLGFSVEELNYGDRFFDRGNTDNSKFPRQYIHIPSITEVKREVLKVGLKLLEVSGEYQISEDDVRKYPPVVYVCGK